MHILIAYDGSPIARAVLEDLRLAGLPPQATALVLCVFDGWLAPDSPDTRDTLPGLKAVRARVQQEIESRRATAEQGAAIVRSAFPKWTIRTDACADNPAWAIIKRAEGSDGGIDGAGSRADLVVVGSHGYSGLKRLALGSVSHKIVTQTRCSVRIARPRASSTSGPPLIVLGFDGSTDSQAALHTVASRHWPADTRAIVATYEQMLDTGVQIAPAAIWGGDPVILPVSSDRPTARRMAEEAAARLSARPSSLGAPLQVSVVVQREDPKRGLVALAEERSADCVFVGAKGVRGIARFVLGSVSTAVAMNAHCSVEVVHPPASNVQGT